MNAPRPLGDSARDALRAYAETEAPPAGAKAAGWEALQSRVAAGDPGPALSGSETAATTTVAASKSPWLIAGLGLVAAGGIAAAALALSGDAPSRDDRSAPAVVSSENPRELDHHADDSPAGPVAGSSIPDAVPPEEAPPIEPTVVDGPAPSPTPASTKHARKTTPKPAAAPSDGPNLGPEVALMGEARQALGNGDAARALELFDRHAQRFPTGVFARERQVSRITALCALGKVSEARRAADRFLARHPDSALASRVRSSCGADPSE